MLSRIHHGRGGQGREGRARSVHLVADACLRHGIRRKYTSDAGPESDEAETFAPPETLSCLGITEDAPRDQSGDLDARHIASRCTQPQRRTLVLERGLGQRALTKLPA